MKSIPAILLRLARWAAVGLALSCALAAVAGQVGRWNNWLDLFNHLAPLWLAGAALALVGWLALGRKGRLAPIAAGLALLIGALQVAPELMAGPGRAKPRPGAETLKLIQFNVWNANIDPKATFRWIMAQDADIVVIEEAEGTPNLHHALWRRYRFRRTCLGYTHCEVMIFSKRKPLASGGLGEQTGFPAAWAAYHGADAPFVIVGAHITWPAPPGPQQWQSKVLAQILKSFPRQRLVVAGDFNSTPWSFSLARQDRLFGLQRRTRAIASWPAQFIWGEPLFPILPIDHVYAGPGWEVVSIERGPKLGSDHFPIVVTLQAR